MHIVSLLNIKYHIFVIKFKYVPIIIIKGKEVYETTNPTENLPSSKVSLPQVPVKLPYCKIDHALKPNKPTLCQFFSIKNQPS